MSECSKHERDRRQGSPCPYCHIAALEADLAKAKLSNAGMHKTIEHLTAKLDAVESDLSNLHDDLHEYGGQRWTPQVINILEALAGEAK